MGGGGAIKYIFHKIGMKKKKTKIQNCNANQ